MGSRGERGDSIRYVCGARGTANRNFSYLSAVEIYPISIEIFFEESLEGPYSYLRRVEVYYSAPGFTLARASPFSRLTEFRDIPAAYKSPLHPYRTQIRLIVSERQSANKT